MHIAFISYEYPPETPNGGIATYVQQAARMLAARGHDVEVFAGSPTRDATLPTDGLLIHRIHVAQRPDFAARVAPAFARRHQAAPFDVMEGPDYDADARFAAQQVPDLPYVVRLHTPRYLAEILNTPLQEGEKRREGEEETQEGTGNREQGTEGADVLSTINDQRSTTDSSFILHPSSLFDYAYRHVIKADGITAPSQAMREIVARDWQIPLERITVFPNVYRPSPALLQLPPAPDSRIVTYFGRLEQRKGVITLARAIPAILRACPDARFRFVGRTLESPEPGITMRDYLARLLAPCAHAVTLSGHISLEEIPALLSDTAICVFPSRWENFPGVCLEAMAAGRAIVGSEAGGMADMLQEDTGVLIPPDNPQRIADAVISLLSDPERREQIGQRARGRVQTVYSPTQLAPLQEAGYEAAIRQKRERDKWLL